MMSADEHDDESTCPLCGRSLVPGCDGAGWMEALGPYQDGSYMTSYPCRNDNPLYETH